MRFTDVMPKKRPTISHYEPSWYGDRPSAVLRQRAGTRIDCNFQFCWIDPHDHDKGFRIMCMHWPDPERNNYKFIVGPGRVGKVRRMTAAELRRPINQWPAGQVRRWRRTSSRFSTRPWSYAQMITAAKARGVVICAELKAHEFTYSGVAGQLVRTAKRVGHPPWFMALYNMDAQHKCPAIRKAGGQFAVIFGDYQYQRKSFHQRKWTVGPNAEW